MAVPKYSVVVVKIHTMMSSLTFPEGTSITWRKTTSDLEQNENDRNCGRLKDHGVGSSDHFSNIMKCK